MPTDYRYTVTAKLSDGSETIQGKSGAPITGVTTDQSFPVVCTKDNHGLKVGDQIYLTGFNEATYLNDDIYTIGRVTDSTFTLASVDARLEKPETSGGQAERAYIDITGADELDEENAISLTWAPVPEADLYVVYRRE